MAAPEYLPGLPSLVGPRLKIERAREHLDELEPEIRAYSQSDPYRIADEPEVEGEWMVVRFAEVRAYPDPRWGVRVGEFFHDLRSSLDNLIWQLVRLNRKEPGNHNQFPIFTDPPRPARLKALRGVEGASRLDDMLFGVHRDQVATIKALQPYHGLDEHKALKVALAGVATFNNIDKHKIVHPALGFSEGDKAAEPVVEHSGGLAPDTIEVDYKVGSPIQEGAEIFRWRVVGGGPDTEVTMHGGVPFDIAFGHRNATLGHLDWMHEKISEIVECFVPAFGADPKGA